MQPNLITPVILQNAVTQMSPAYLWVFLSSEYWHLAWNFTSKMAYTSFSIKNPPVSYQSSNDFTCSLILAPMSCLCRILDLTCISCPTANILTQLNQGDSLFSFGSPKWPQNKYSSEFITEDQGLTCKDFTEHHRMRFLKEYLDILFLKSLCLA